MIEVKVGDLYRCKASLPMLGSIEIDGGSGVHLARLVKKVKAEIDTVDEERSKLFYKFGKLVDGKTWEITPENMDAYNAAIDAMSNQVLKLEGVDRFLLPKTTKVKLGILVDWEQFIGVKE